MAGSRMVWGVFWAFVAIVVLAPLPYGAVHLWSFSLLALLVGAAVAAWGAVALVRPEACPVKFRRYGPVLALVAPVLAWVGLQACPALPGALDHPLWAEAGAALGRPVTPTVSLDPDATLLVLMRMTTYCGVFWLAMQLCADWRRALFAVWAVAAAGFAYATYGLFAYLTMPGTILFGPKWAYFLSLTGTFVNRNHYALYAGFGLIASFALMIRYARRSASGAFDNSRRFFEGIENLRLPVFLLMANCIVIGTALLLSQSRGGLVFTAVALAAIVLMLSGGRGGTQRRSTLVILGALFVGGAALFAISGDLLVLRLMTPNSGGSSRADVYALTLDAIARAPLTGHGAGSFPVLFHLMRTAEFPALSAVYTEAHNVYLEFAAGAGLIAAVLYFSALGLIGLTCLAAVRRQRIHTVFPAIGAAATLLAGMHSLFDFGPQTPAVAVTLAALMGIGFGQVRTGDDGRAADQSGVR